MTTTNPSLPRVAMLARAVFPLHGFGGIERHVFHLVTHLAKLGVPIDLWAQTPPADADTSSHATRQLLDDPLITLHTARYDRTTPLLRPNSIVGRQINYPLYSLDIASDLRRHGIERFDIVHSQGLAGLGWGWQRLRHPELRRVPFFANPHGMEEYKSPDWKKLVAYTPFRALYSWTHRAADQAIATDACTRGDLPALLGVEQRRVVVVPSAIDVAESLGLVRDDLRPELRARFGLDRHALTLLAVSRLERNKGYHLLLEALAQLRERMPSAWQLILAGRGKEEQALRDQAQALGIAQHVTLAGRLSDEELHTLYEQIDLFVHPTLYEGSSLVTLEAMVHRRPVVATAAGGIPDKVFSGRNGVLVQPNSTRALANGLLLALQQRDHWPAWGLAGERIVRETFDWPVVAQRQLDAYLAALRR